MLRQDYILRLIEEMGRFVAEVVALRRRGQHLQALLAVVQAQEKLFARPGAEIAALDLPAQVAALAAGEPPAVAVQKIVAHARQLAEAALCYRELRQDLALAGARTAVQDVLRLGRERFPAVWDEAAPPSLRAEIETLLAQTATGA